MSRTCALAAAEGRARNRRHAGDVARMRAARRGWAACKGGGEGVTLRAGLAAALASFAELGGAEEEEVEEAVAAGV